jgi:hypothetical protein
MRRSAGRLAAGTVTFYVTIRLYLIAAFNTGHGISPAFSQELRPVSPIAGLNI